MRKLTFVLAMLALMFVAAPAYAQGAAAAPSMHIGNWFLAGVGLSLAVAGAAYAQSKVAAAACEGLARNPAARPGIQLALILGLAFIESLVLFVWVMIFLNKTA
jgi:F-type H+-transporting ATPase subunit c